MEFRITIDSMSGSENCGSFETKEAAIIEAKKIADHRAKVGDFSCSVAVRQRKQLPNGPMVVWPIVADFDPK
jgi:hypothetical protein